MPPAGSGQVAGRKSLVAACDLRQAGRKLMTVVAAGRQKEQQGDIVCAVKACKYGCRMIATEVSLWGGVR